MFNHGFRTPSSIFYLSSLFYLPKTGYNLIHLAPVFFLGFANYIFINKIYVNLHYLPVHLQPLYENMKIKRRDLINSEEHALSAISLPIFPDLNKKEQTRVIKVIRLFFKRNNNHNDPSKKKMTKNKDF